MLTQLIFDSFLFWVFLGVIVFASVYIGRAAIRMHEYEKQVDRGWQDLINRADEMIKKLNDMTHEIKKIREEPSSRTKK